MLSNLKVVLVLSLVAFISGCRSEKTLDDLVSEHNKASYNQRQLEDGDILYEDAPWGDRYYGTPTEFVVESGFERVLQNLPEDYPKEEIQKVEKARDEFRVKIQQAKSDLSKPEKAFKILDRAVKDLQSFQAKKDKLTARLDDKISTYNRHFNGIHWYQDHGDILKKYTGVPTVKDIQEGFKRLLEDYPEGHPEERRKVEEARDHLESAISEAKQHKLFSDTRQFHVLKDYKHKLYKFQAIKESLH